MMHTKTHFIAVSVALAVGLAVSSHLGAATIFSANDVTVAPGSKAIIQVSIDTEGDLIQGHSYGVEFVGGEAFGLTAANARLGSETVSVVPGGTPSFWATNFYSSPAGVTEGQTYDSAAAAYAFDGPVLEIDVPIPASVPDGTVIPVQFVSDLGSPPVSIIYVQGGQSMAPDTVAGSITVDTDAPTATFSVDDVTALAGSTATVRVTIDTAGGLIQGHSYGVEFVGGEALGLVVTDARLGSETVSVLPGGTPDFWATNFYSSPTGVTEGQTYDSSATHYALDGPVLEIDVSIPASVPDGTVIPVQFVGDLGSPQVSIVYAQGGLSMSPDTVAGSITVGPAIPEPATMALLGLAACGLGGYVRRRRTG